MYFKTYAFTFGRKLFLSVSAMFLIFAACFILFQHQREKYFRIELLDNRLADYNDQIYMRLQKTPPATANIQHHIKDCIQGHIRLLQDEEDVRITIIAHNGQVLYDSEGTAPQNFNHLQRKEVQEAINKGKGRDVGRLSESTGTTYFYSATKYDEYIVRTAMPYSNKLIETLKTDSRYIWFSVGLVIVLIFIFYKVVNSMGTSINQLRQFTNHIEQNEPYETLLQSMAGNDELSEISQHIVNVYQRMHKAKEALYIEREKLIAHLQSSREGLAVFNERKKEILANPLFVQYANIISDHNLKQTEAIFDIAEFEPITAFITQTQTKPIQKAEMRRSININKSGRIFMVECIIFQDLSFEISINDISQKEEQTMLKRQLTQNIAHELKTPVSSIQAYLETIVTNPNIAPDKAAIFLNRCYEQSNRLTRLLRDISVLTRMDEAAYMLEMERVDVSETVKKITNELALELEKKQMSVHNQLKDGIEIRGNHSLIYSIFRNLMDNAIAYAGTQTQITISCFREDDNLYYFSFADTGVGISPEHMQRLFERFYRVDKGRSRKLGGTGLGLAIVKNAVIIHGGNISAKNNQGGGLEFIFTLAKEK